MARRTRARIDLRRASLRKLEALLEHASARVVSLSNLIYRLNLQAEQSETELSHITASLSELDDRLSHLQKLRTLRGGILGKLFRLKVRPAFAVTEIASICATRHDLVMRKSELVRVRESIGMKQESLERAKTWLQKVEEATDRKRRQRDTLLNLRAAASANNTVARQLASSVKQNLSKQPWCPYCGGPLGETPHADHIYPVSRGGRSVHTNMVYVCAQCNSMKRDLTLSTFIKMFSLDRGAIEARLETLGKDF